MDINLIQGIYSFTKDNRKNIYDLYKSYSELDSEKWNQKIIFNQDFPILGFETKKKGPALWIMAGIHGEEPAGPIALSKNIKFLNKISKKIPIVLLPLCNPEGYRKNWRYFNRKKSPKNEKIPAQSVGDSSHFLLNEKNMPRENKPSSKQALALTNYVIKTSRTHPPILSLDLHEDESKRKLYIYSQGWLGVRDPIALKIVSILKKLKFEFYEQGKTRFKEEIHKGIVTSIKDSSIDELIAAEKIIKDNKIKKGPCAKSVIVIETTTNFPIKKRIKAHYKIIKSSKKLFKMALKLE